MFWLHLLFCFLGGVFLANGLPHFFSGIMGRPFHSPFANPPGQGLSSPIINILWGFANFVMAYVFLICPGSFNIHAPAQAASSGLGVLVMGLFCAFWFGKFQPRHPQA